jgi:hypothetical protein
MAMVMSIIQNTLEDPALVLFLVIRDQCTLYIITFLSYVDEKHASLYVAKDLDRDINPSDEIPVISRSRQIVMDPI